jgi:hypothetical protein
VVETLRAKAIERLLPPLVHRLNNAIAIIQGAVELEASASVQDRANARRELAVLSTTLVRLALFARAPSTRLQVIALETLGETCRLLLRPLAQTSHVDFRVRARSGLSTRADARLETLLLLAAYELIQASVMEAGGPRSVRLTIDAEGDRARLVLTAAGRTGLPRAAGALEAYAHERGLVFRQRVTTRGICLRLHMSLLFERVVPVERAPAARPRVLLIQAEGQDRELAATVLREQGCEVHEQSLAPRAGDFELVLVDERVLDRDPAAARLDGVAYRRLERIRPPLRVAELLGFLGD